MHLFGCFGLKKKEYCILNKQYAPEEYKKLRAKIVEQMNEKPYVVEKRHTTSDKDTIVYRYGEFFPPELSPLAYNESVADDYFPLSEAGAKAKGFLWRSPSAKEYAITTQAKHLPDHIG